MLPCRAAIWTGACLAGVRYSPFAIRRREETDGDEEHRAPCEVTHVPLYNQGILKEGTSHPHCSNEPCVLLLHGCGNLHTPPTPIHTVWYALSWYEDKRCTSVLKLQWVPSQSRFVTHRYFLIFGCVLLSVFSVEIRPRVGGLRLQRSEIMCPKQQTKICTIKKPNTL